MVDYDVIVSGAGPAGSYAAYRCAKAGLRTVLLEKMGTPRDKVCAGGVLERAVRTLDFPIPDGVIEKEIMGMALISGDSRSEIRSKGRMGITVRRSVFDDFLVKKAESVGAEFLDEVGSTEANELEDEVRVVTKRGEFRGKLLIVAEGVNSPNAKRLVGEYVKNEQVAGVTVELNLNQDPGDLMEFHFFHSDGKRFHPPALGYGWMFPRRNACNIGIGVKGMGKEALQARIKEIADVTEARCSGGAQVGPQRAHPFPLRMRRTIRSRRSMVVGDAGGLANPATGEGLSYAFQTARLASDSATDFITNGNGAAPAIYERRCRDTVISDINGARLIAGAIRSTLGPLSTGKFFESFCASDKLVRASFDIIQGNRNWHALLGVVIPDLPRLYFSSIK